MAERSRLRPIPLVLALSACVLIAAAALRSFEYDEAYSFFVNSGVPRPIWPSIPFTAGSVRAAFAGQTSFALIAQALRQTDVHPPLYFWALHLWQMLAGHSLFSARMLSVLFGLGSLTLVAAIARESRIPAPLAMVLTLGCYGFAYTSAIARGFALAELLMLSGVLLALIAARRCSASLSLTAGLLLGAASFANYLASFTGAATVLWLLLQQSFMATEARPPSVMTAKAMPQSVMAGEALPQFVMAGEGRPSTTSRTKKVHALYFAAAVGFLIWIPADLWFFIPQRNSRTGQFPPFEWLPGLTRLARYDAGSVLGALPLYVSGPAQTILAGALTAGLILLLSVIVLRWRTLGRPKPCLLLGLGAVATPTGLILLGLLFNTTPIELRYFSFSAPFVALLSAGALAALPRRAGLIGGAVLIGVQALAIAGLLVRSETMQPARATAAAAAALVGPHGLVLLPRGNDGVGVVGPFLYEAPDWLPVLLIRSDASPEQIRASVAEMPRILLATEEPDADSRMALRAMHTAIAGPCWHVTATGFNVVVFDRQCDGN